ncbi:hypothetical protein, partial [uncultured Sutterella sp.]|uniref:hypothetical protein n=1 Tax=uncultured Sutterella sp. TaxID=286133 RepID=UPI002614401A
MIKISPAFRVRVFDDTRVHDPFFSPGLSVLRLFAVKLLHAGKDGSGGINRKKEAPACNLNCSVGVRMNAPERATPT